ncbi:unnamed protein product [Protopolystoma xenopodis]|uniref:J domain-containing protein n=1 Tax=Protopolystoma xenopodis TaxID=117903 RepID=A0A448WSU2_9PLAT|nr:unnamed protein product [Protopolystoma xenopodis]
MYILLNRVIEPPFNTFMMFWEYLKRLVRLKSEAHIKRWQKNDRNPNEDTHQEFIKASEAYEILSDPKKRHEYDTFGHVVGEGHAPPPGFHPHRQKFVFQAPFEDLFQAFFYSGPETEALSQYLIELDFRSYRLKHLPTSRVTPILFLGYSDFCFTCQRIKPLWAKIADELTPLGVAVSRANLEKDQALREELRLLHSPGILAVITYYYRSEFSQRNVVEFLRTVLLESNPSQASLALGASLLSANLDTPLVTKLESLSEVVAFQSAWRIDSRPRALFITSDQEPSLLFALAAYRSADYVASGFINSQLQEARTVMMNFNLLRSEI